MAQEPLHAGRRGVDEGVYRTSHTHVSPSGRVDAQYRPGYHGLFFLKSSQLERLLGRQNALPPAGASNPHDLQTSRCNGDGTYQMTYSSTQHHSMTINCWYISFFRHIPPLVVALSAKRCRGRTLTQDPGCDSSALDGFYPPTRAAPVPGSRLANWPTVY